MRVAFWVTVVASLPALYTPAPQSTEEEAIKAVVHAVIKAADDRNFDAWQALWIHDPNVTRSFVSNGVYLSQTGWDKVSTDRMKQMKGAPTPPPERKLDNWVIRHDGKLAWVFWDQITTSKQHPYGTNTHREYRVLVKDGGRWKIASQITHVVNQFEGPRAIESGINNTGYALLDAGKHKEAIEAFKMNVQLHPNSWFAYDSLGEGYAEAGQKDLAIKNYEKSVELNPKNETGLAALKKLRQP